MNFPSKTDLQKRGFSLVELCVAIGIIALLAVFLFAAAGRLISSGKNARCLANLRSFHSAFMAYAADHQGNIPRYRTWTILPNGTAVGNASWRQVLAQYLPYPGEYDTCPLSKTPFNVTKKINYGMSSAMGGSLVTFQNPAASLLAADSTGPIRVRPPGADEPGGTGDFAFCHDGKAQLLFLDGHVEKRALQEIPHIGLRNQPFYHAFWAGK